MLAAERQARIVELVRKQGSVQVEDLALALNVSPMTIRRDLEKLQESNKLERCHGGAVAKKEVTYADKSVSHRKEKVKLAEICAGFVNEGDTVFLDAGTTTFEIARRIKDIPDIMVVTNDLEIAGLVKGSDAELILCGGVVQKSTGSMLGYYATRMLEDFHFDVGFFGAASVNHQFEVMTPTIDKAFLKRQAVRQCREAYLVVDESKFNRQGMARINDLGDYTAVVTEKIFDGQEMEVMKKLGARVIQAFDD